MARARVWAAKLSIKTRGVRARLGELNRALYALGGVLADAVLAVVYPLLPKSPGANRSVDDEG